MFARIRYFNISLEMLWVLHKPVVFFQIIITSRKGKEANTMVGRRGVNRLPRIALDSKEEGKRPRGRWKDQVLGQKDTEKVRWGKRNVEGWKR